MRTGYRLVQFFFPLRTHSGRSVCVLCKGFWGAHTIVGKCAPRVHMWLCVCICTCERLQNELRSDDCI